MRRDKTYKMLSACPVVVMEDVFHAGHIFESLSEMQDCAMAVGVTANTASSVVVLLRPTLRRTLLLLGLGDSSACTASRFISAISSQ